jgi:hypothetical protein
LSVVSFCTAARMRFISHPGFLRFRWVCSGGRFSQAGLVNGYSAFHTDVSWVNWGASRFFSKLVEGDSLDDMSSLAAIVGKLTARVIEKSY